MSKKCPIYGVAIYLDCLECEERRCKMGIKESLQKELKQSKAKYIGNQELKLDIDDKIYFILGNPSKQIVLSGIIQKIVLHRNRKIVYNFDQVKIELDRKQELRGQNIHEFGFFYDYNINTGNAIGAIAVFTTKQKTIEYLRKCKK